MKKFQLLFCVVVLIMISCTLSNEEKAEKLVKETLKIISITQILMSRYQQGLTVCLLM